MLGLRFTLKSSDAPLAARRAIDSSTCFSFVLLLVLLLSVAMVFDKPTVSEREHPATPLLSSDTTPSTPASSFSVDAGPVHRPSFLVGPSAPLRKPDSTVLASLMERYSQSPLTFEANQGQTDPTVEFFSRGVGYNLFLTPNEAVVVLRRPPVDRDQSSTKRDAEFRTGTSKLDARSPNAKSSTPELGFDAPSFAVMRMRFIGANSAPRIAGSEQLP